MKKIVAIEPLTNCEMTYINTMQSMISSKYSVVSYQDAKKGYYNVKDLGVLYLNWIEAYTSDNDKSFIKSAKAEGVKIVWVFHNKFPHDAKDKEKALENIKFYISIADKICILSHKSVEVLQKYCNGLDVRKIHFLPHQDFFDMFGKLSNPRFDIDISDDCVRFSCLGQIRPYKNIELLIEAFQKFRYKDRAKLLIAGRPIDMEYVEKLKKIKCSDNIILDPTYIPSSMMGKYIDDSDVLILPYNQDSSMNSGAMIMSFSYGRTVIVPNIEMVSEFPEDCVYSYHYASREEHLSNLIFNLEKAFEDGREVLHHKGNILKDYLCKHNSKAIVKRNILSLFDELVDDAVTDYSYSVINQLIREREFLREQCKLIVSKNRLQMDGYQISDLLWKSGIYEIAIYGYGHEGRKVFEELINNGIKVSFIIDKMGSQIKADVPVYCPTDVIPPIGYILVTSAFIDIHSFIENNRNQFCCIILKEMY